MMDFLTKPQANNKQQKPDSDYKILKENVKGLLELNCPSQEITTYFSTLLFLKHWTNVSAHGSTSTKKVGIVPISLS